MELNKTEHYRTAKGTANGTASNRTEQYTAIKNKWLKIIEVKKILQTSISRKNDAKRRHTKSTILFNHNLA